MNDINNGVKKETLLSTIHKIRIFAHKQKSISFLSFYTYHKLANSLTDEYMAKKHKKGVRDKKYV